ncbi:mepB family protein [Staphylococcus aureus]|uniref:MepB family protein n=1 Tax=Staphylococcus aureus TaxID=1280 RepID=A0A2X2JSD4_STAAU|nr:mepB family protein [Staphylococcus aureus]
MYKSKILLKYIFSEESDVKDLTEEKYNQDYEALTFSFKEETYQSRLAKKTPTKAGYLLHVGQKTRTIVINHTQKRHLQIT